MMTWICLKHALPASITYQGARDSLVIYALKGIEYTSSWLYRLITLLHCMTVTRHSSLIRFSKSFKYITLSCSASISPQKMKNAHFVDYNFKNGKIEFLESIKRQFSLPTNKIIKSQNLDKFKLYVGTDANRSSWSW